MTKPQFDRAFAIARSDRDLTGITDEILHGCGLPNFKPVTITLEVAAVFLRWQCIQLNGQVDAAALNECREISRRKWLCVD